MRTKLNEVAGSGTQTYEQFDEEWPLVQIIDVAVVLAMRRGAMRREDAFPEQGRMNRVTLIFGIFFDWK